MYIEDVLNRYFEGETSAEEERQLRVFFASDGVPDHLADYTPLFAYFDEEIKKEAPGSKATHRSEVRRGTLYILSGVAACVLALLGIGRLLYPADTLFCSGNYVVINGRCYTDIHKVRSFAFEALQEVATPVDAYFPEADGEASDREIIDNQLKELGSFFSDDE